jgi:hypothetical protein
MKEYTGRGCDGWLAETGDELSKRTFSFATLTALEEGSIVPHMWIVDMWWDMNECDYIVFLV